MNAFHGRVLPVLYTATLPCARNQVPFHFIRHFSCRHKLVPFVPKDIWLQTILNSRLLGIMGKYSADGPFSVDDFLDHRFTFCPVTMDTFFNVVFFNFGGTEII